ncbi:MAG: dipicolinate synthase subunit DpsA [Lachnospiraceae bacterium]
MSHSILQNNPVAAVIGTDARQVYLAQILSKNGADVRVFGLPTSAAASVCCCDTLEETVSQADIVLLPVPLFRENLFHVTTQFFDTKTQKKSAVRLTLNAESLISLLPEHCHLFAGAIPDFFLMQAQEKNIYCHDYLKCPSIRWKNTIATAEGMLAEAIFRSDRTLTDSCCLVLGCGHCGSTLLSYLRHFHCTTFTYDRDTKALARSSLLADPVSSIESLCSRIESCDVIFQTIPHFSLCADCAAKIRPDAVFLDITSPPCTLENSAVVPVLLPALPGRLAPRTSAELLWDCIKQEDFYDSKF